MVEFGSLGSVSEFAERTGQDLSDELLRQYTAALALGRRINARTPAGTESRTHACFVKSLDEAEELVALEYYDPEGVRRDGYELDTEGEAQVETLREGSPLWLTVTPIEGMHVGGEDCSQWQLDIAIPEPGRIHGALQHASRK